MIDRPSRARKDLEGIPKKGLVGALGISRYSKKDLTDSLGILERDSWIAQGSPLQGFQKGIPYC